MGSLGLGPEMPLNYWSKLCHCGRHSLYLIEFQVACGPNSLCSQSGRCECPEGFAGVPTAKEGCVRIPSACTTPANCPEGTQCYNG